MSEQHLTRRNVLFSFGGLSASAWLASNWPNIAAAAEHAAHAATSVAPTSFEFLSAAEAADVDAMTAQVLPSGKTPGAREAHAVHFIDRALATFFADRAPVFRAGLGEVARTFRARYPATPSFAQASEGDQHAFLTSIELSAFFESLRMLTILGTFSASRYGGNFEGAGWKLLGFEDQHVFTSPFGYYDRDYPGFEIAAGGVQS
jgi:gluconate 2-dehydrogenase gamma chain